MCLPHGETSPFLKQHTFSNHTKIIDLSNDFRLQANAQDFVYGLPELNKEKLKLPIKLPIQVVLLLQYNSVCYH